MTTKYRKKPVIVDAHKYDGDGFYAIEWSSTVKEIQNTDTYLYIVLGEGLYIHTLEGDMLVNVGDYIICGVKGEFYPCKPDIFEQTYEPVEGD